MKKIIAFVAVLISCLALTACSKKLSATLDVEAECLRESIVLKATLNDSKKQLEDSEIKYVVREKESNKEVKSGKLIFEDDENFTEVTIKSLKADTSYSIKVTAGYEGKEYTLFTKEYKTVTQGVKEEPYKITSASDFSKKVKYDRNAYYELANDIDFNGEYTDPMFSSSEPFEGHFDGKGFKIHNIRIGNEESPKTFGSSYMGLFGYVGSEGVIENLNFDDVVVFARRTSTGYFAILAGYNSGSIKNVNITNSSLTAIGTTSEYYVGGLVGVNRGHGNITNVNVDVDITAKCKRTMFVGGIIAENEVEQTAPRRNVLKTATYEGTINVTVIGESEQDMTTNVMVGGIAARNFSTIEAATATAEITVKTQFKAPSKETYNVMVGGLVAHNANKGSVLKDSHVTGSFTVEAMDALRFYVGAIVGVNGTKGESRSMIIGCTYTLPEEKTNLVATYATRKVVAPEEGTEGGEETTTPSTTSEPLPLEPKEFYYGIGLVGMDLVNDVVTSDLYSTTKAFNITFVLREKAKNPEEADKDIKTETIEVAGPITASK